MNHIRLGLDLFNRQLQALLRGEEVELPQFNNMEKGVQRTAKIDEHTIYNIEGIHTQSGTDSHIPSENNSKIYMYRH